MTTTAPSYRRRLLVESLTVLAVDASVQVAQDRRSALTPTADTNKREQL